MNLAIDVAPVEDVLVEQITEYERGECKDRHTDPANRECSLVAVAVVSTKCRPWSALICEKSARYGESVIADPFEECSCGSRCADCWSVVMLP